MKHPFTETELNGLEVTVAACQTYLTLIGTLKDLRFAAKTLRGFALGTPISKGTGVCYNLHNAKMTSTLDAYRLVTSLFGGERFPIGFPMGNFLYSLDSESGTLWEDERGAMRRKLCTFLAELIEAEIKNREKPLENI